MGRVMGGLYAGFAAILYACAWPVLAVLGWRDHGWRERLGYYAADVPRGALWVHAASVGEVTALAPFLRELARRRGRKPIVLSVMTPAGARRARELFRFPVVHPPLEASGPVRRWVAAADPAALLVMETELWPVWLLAALDHGPVLWINGRISDRSYPRYRLIRAVMRPILARLSLLCVITARDGRRAVDLGARRARVRVTGNLKVDALVPARSPAGLGPGPWLVAGSTRPGEEPVVLEAFRRVLAAAPGARLCLAPRHLNRVAEIEALARGAGFTVSRRTARRSGRSQVLLLDTHGELAAAYRGAAAAFVGGTLVPIGGHNVLEPALAGVAVCFGPHTTNVKDDAAGLVRAGGGFVVRDARTLGDRWLHLVRLPRAPGRRALRYVRGKQGVARRVVALLSGGGWV